MEYKNNEQLLGAIEAFLFIFGDPVEIKKIADVLEIEVEAAQKAVDELKLNLDKQDRGLSLVFSGKKIQLVTKPEFAPIIEKSVKQEFEENLTPAALETLSLVAYLGPISRPKVDYLRGVNSSYSIRNLLLRGLVERINDPNNAHVPLYQVSFDLLKHLGVSNIEDLPDYNKYKELISEA